MQREGEGQKDAFFYTNNLERLSAILMHGLGPLDANTRQELVRSSLQREPGLNVRTDVIARLAAQHGMFGGRAEPESARLLDKAAVEERVEHCREEIRKAAQCGSLLSHPYSLRLLWMATLVFPA